MDLSIIIANWNVRELLTQCLNSIFSRLKSRKFEVIVVDNASEDGSVQIVEQKFPQVRLITNDANYGFAKASNQGIKIAQGKYLFFLNPDSEVTDSTYEKIMDFMESHPQVGVGGCYLYYPDGKIQTSFYNFTSLTNCLGRALLLHSFFPKNKLTSSLFFEHFRQDKAIERVCGGAMVVRREALEEVGLFDESFFLYYEDEDLCYRMKQKGWKIAPISNTKIIHYHNQSGKRNIRKAVFSGYQSQFLFYRKFHPFPKVMIFRIIQLVGVTIRTFFWFFKLTGVAKQETARQKFLGYSSLLLSDFHYKKSLIN